jgi:hypothetical protein
MSETIPPITLPPVNDFLEEQKWLAETLHQWLDNEYIPQLVNYDIAQRATQIYIRQRMEGEDDLGTLVIAIVTEMQQFNFQDTFFGEFVVANAISDLLTTRIGLDKCCG